MENIKVGEIFILYNEGTNPPKEKINICIHNKWFFVVNTKDNYPASLKISQSASNFLKYDSYICCSRIFQLYRKKCIINRKETLPDEIIQSLIDYIPCVIQLTPIQIDTITISLRNVLLSSKLQS